MTSGWFLFSGAGDSTELDHVHALPVLYCRAPSLVPGGLRTTPLTRVLGQDSHVSGLQRRQCCVSDWTGECLASKRDWEIVWDLLDGMLSEYQVS